ncbi:E-selectin [Mastacembelus armatus]|uniref:E-selectin n=1 Tax=Mastacembelus armatus TaxID=205130 RepID=UPI000E4646DB|nr:E-selectin-like [Mastacembelus armatus]
MKWMLFLVLGSSLTDTTVGWTYHYSNYTMTWTRARWYCQTHYTDMVTIQNQKENDYLVSILPNRTGSPYYWIGITKAHMNETWTWVGTNSTWIGEQSWATNEPNNNLSTEFCVEIYTNRGKNRGKWNDEKCSKKKYAVCYQASCTQDSCSKHADCVETIGNYTCRCHPGFFGPRCEEAIACGALLDPEKGSHYCFNPHGSNSFNSSCWFHCELGFRLVDVTKLLWNNPVPLCQVEQCPVLNQTSISGNVTCSHPIAPYSFNSSCEFRCDEGYELHGQEQIQCDHTGQWTASVPACTLKRMIQALLAVAGCGAFSAFCYICFRWIKQKKKETFPSQYCFDINEGQDCVEIYIKRDKDTGKWNNEKCRNKKGTICYTASSCWFHCELGFRLVDATKLLWNNPVPLCQVEQCPVLNQTSISGNVTCSHPIAPYSFNSSCEFRCDEGYELHGQEQIQCDHTGQWTASVPACTTRQCPLLDSRCGSTIWPHSPFSYGSHCDFNCNEGFLVRETPVVTCNNSGSVSFL